MFSLRFKLILVVTLICCGTSDAGYYVIPYGFDNPFEPLPEPIKAPIPTTTIPPPTVTTTETLPSTTSTPPVTTTTEPPPVTTTTEPPPVTTTEVQVTSTPTPCVTPPPRCQKDGFLIKYYYQFNHYYPSNGRIALPVYKPITIQTEQLLPGDTPLHSQGSLRLHQTAPLQHPEQITYEQTYITGPNVHGPTVRLMRNDNSPHFGEQHSCTSSVVQSHSGLNFGDLPMNVRWQGITASTRNDYTPYNELLNPGRTLYNYPQSVYQPLDDPQVYPISV